MAGRDILIPAYNEAAVIATCIGSVLTADYPRLEVLVLDDGSTDDTEAVALAAASRRSAVQGAPRPGQPWEGGAAQRRLPRGPERARRGDGRRHARAPRGAQAPRCKDAAISARRSRCGCAARHEPRQVDPGAPSARGGLDHRHDPQDAVAHRPRRRRRGRARTLPSRTCSRGWRLRLAHGDRGHRAVVEAPPGRVAYRVRAARTGWDAGAGHTSRPCGRSESAGPGVKGRCSTFTSDR